MKPISKYVDHTQLKPAAQRTAIEKLCREAAEMDTASVCVNPYYVPLAKELLKDTDVKVCTVIGFPLGQNTPAVKAFETEQAYNDGCDEFDMVINIAALKDGMNDYVRDEIAAVVKAAKGRLVKVIIETFLLTDEEKARVVKLACEAGANFVKTCTGFSGGAANVHDVALMKANVTGGVEVKASAGIRSYADAKALIEAGATRLGTSAGAVIIEESKNA